MFIKFMRIVATVFVAWLLWRLVLPRNRPSHRNRTSRTDRRRQPNRKYVHSSVVDRDDGAREETDR